VRHLIDELLRDVGVDVSHESEAATLAAGRIAHDLRLLHLTEYLEVAQKVFVGQRVVQTAHEDFVADTLHQLLFLLFRLARCLRSP